MDIVSKIMGVKGILKLLQYPPKLSSTEIVQPVYLPKTAPDLLNSCQHTVSPKA